MQKVLTFLISEKPLSQCILGSIFGIIFGIIFGLATADMFIESISIQPYLTKYESDQPYLTKYESDEIIDIIRKIKEKN